MAVAALPAEIKFAVPLIKAGAPGDQLFDSTGRLPDHRIHHLRMAEATAGDQRVGHMVVEAILRINNAGNASLGILTRRFTEIIFGDHRHRQARVDFHRRPQPRQPSAENEHIRETVRHSPWPKRHQIARAFKRIDHCVESPWV